MIQQASNPQIDRPSLPEKHAALLIDALDREDTDCIAVILGMMIFDPERTANLAEFEHTRCAEHRV